VPTEGLRAAQIRAVGNLEVSLREKQALKELQNYTAPDDGRKFIELYNVQRLTANKLDPVARVVITTIQRLYSMLKGEADLPAEAEEPGLAGYFDAERADEPERAGKTARRTRARVRPEAVKGERSDG